MQALWAKRKEREAMAKKEEFEKCGQGGRLFEPHGFPMRWRAFLKCKFEMSPAWLNNPNQYIMT
jgi:hypothetical protein